MPTLLQFLALAVGLGSFSLYMVPFFFPEVYRRYDWIWSGVGTGYAIVLWSYSAAIPPGLAVGQFAAVALLGRFIGQTLELRRAIAPDAEKTAFPEAGVTLTAVLRFKLASLLSFLAQQVSPSSPPTDHSS